ncbi:MAG TPA: STAS domain-containing protein [Blastocatellia bacterium]|nr:STAS domain-containing protein [Blastocatellia bacterium]
MKRPTKFWTRKVGSVNIIDVTGRLAPEGTDDALFKVVSNLVEQGEQKFLVDLSSTTFISSLGVGSLLRASRAAEAKDGELKLLNPSHSVARILELSRMTDVFQIFEHEQEAVASFDTKTPREPEEEEKEEKEEKPPAKKAAKPRKSRKKAAETDDE